MKKSETHTLRPAFFRSTSADLQIEVTVLLESCFFSVKKALVGVKNVSEKFCHKNQIMS